MLWKNKKSSSKTSCAASVNSQHQKSVDLNRKYLLKIKQTVHMMGKQALAFVA